MSFRKLRTIGLVLATPVAVGALTWWWLPDLDSPEMPTVAITANQAGAADVETVKTVAALPVKRDIAVPPVTLQPVIGPGFALPVDCIVGKDCFIQNYVDRQAGPGMKDHQCGEDGYDGHKGVDFAIHDMVTLNQGVDVLAAADGVVIGFRNGMADGHPKMTGYKKGGKDCGNRVGIKHVNGWLTTYCHMKKDGFTVKNGDKVKAGDKLGQIGQSGMAEFPHLHFSAQKVNEFYDPFGAVPLTAACDAGKGSLWTKQAQAKMPYRGVEIPWAGFALRGITSAEINAGLPVVTRAPQNVPALVLYARASNIDKGQKLVLAIYQPDGKQWTGGGSDAMSRSRARQMQMVGRKGAGKTLMAGTWTGQVEVVDAAGNPVARRIVSLDVTP